MSERWLPVVGFEGRYEVSDRGNCRRIRRDGSRRAMCASPDTKGYLIFRLTLNGVRKHLKAHRAVLDAFVGPQPDMFALHADDDPANNHIENLRWGTRLDNAADWIANGRRRSVPYHNALKTHCPQGHEYTPDNTDMRARRGHIHRACRICRQAQRRGKKAPIAT